MAEKICCEETTVNNNQQMNDRDYLNDLLESEKNLRVNLSIALNEASNNKFYEELNKMYNDISQIQRDAFYLAWNKGWYVLEEAEQTKINQSQKKLQKLIDELNNKNQEQTINEEADK